MGAWLVKSDKALSKTELDTPENLILIKQDNA